MFDEPDEPPAERAIDPLDRARDKFDEFRMHAELAAVFEGTRKFEARLVPGLDPELAREVQRSIATLEKSKAADLPILPPPVMPGVIKLLTIPAARELS